MSDDCLVKMVEELNKDITQLKAHMQYERNKHKQEMERYKGHVKGELRKVLELELLGLEDVARVNPDGKRITRRVDRIRERIRNVLG